MIILFVRDNIGMRDLVEYFVIVLMLLALVFHLTSNNVTIV